MFCLIAKALVLGVLILAVIVLAWVAVAFLLDRVSPLKKARKSFEPDPVIDHRRA
jgi:hypothetical protein